MTKYTGGNTVKPGFYWNRAKWGAEIVPAAGGELPGTEADLYYRIGWPVLLVAAPVMGGAFAMFLPFIGLAMLAQLLFRAVTGRRGSPRGGEQTGSHRSDYERAA
jgi:hypothetical protein